MRFVVLALVSLALAGCSDRTGDSQAPSSRSGTDKAVTVASVPVKPDSGSLAIRCETLIDGASAEPLASVLVTIRDGRIADVTRKGSPPDDLPLLDLTGYTCLPGLIDMHTHLNERPEDTVDFRIFYERTREQAAEISRRNAEVTLQAGFTTVRNLGSYMAWADRDLRDAIDRGEVAGPRMQVTGFYLTIPGGGGDVVMPEVPESSIPAHLRAGISKGPQQFQRNAERALEGSADLLKIIASGAVLAHGGVPGEPEMTPEEIAAVTRVAHENGRLVAAHAHGARSIREAIQAGANTIEHASLIDDAGIRLAVEKQVALSMDVYNGDYIDREGRKQGWPGEFLRKNLETTEAQRQAFTRAHAAGAPIVYGTDAGVYPHGFNARQFPIMVQRGMKPTEAIRAATSLAARYMGWSDRVGALQPGLFGDLIAVRGDPLKDISVLQDVQVVVKGGLVFKMPAGAR